MIFATVFREWRYVYGVVVMDEEGNELYSPNYPFCQNVEDTVVLEEFIEDFGGHLIDYLENRMQRGFSEYLLGFNTEAKYFKDRWYYRGVIVD